MPGADLAEACRTARDAGCAGLELRAHPDTGVHVGMEEAERAQARRLHAVADRARVAGVRLLVETHDSHPTGRDVRRLLDAAGVPDVTGAIWDALHPWRHGESPVDTLAEIRRLLVREGYRGWVSLEWERTWYPRVASVGSVLPGALAWVRG
ncbi:TIM barrel protein [Microtetraspora sp. NBRC 16547]|uniref:sugar phosphate isomerase/epimerase family protein n=1 Tax=Microtetraspora sp. NBRC 16547 TaxID=3030993 RepID=UPI00255562E1|nr:TIM barrel protein [Microtetraspora sp. NBRC 16547]